MGTHGGTHGVLDPQVAVINEAMAAGLTTKISKAHLKEVLTGYSRGAAMARRTEKRFGVI